MFRLYFYKIKCVRSDWNLIDIYNVSNTCVNLEIPTLYSYYVYSTSTSHLLYFSVSYKVNQHSHRSSKCNRVVVTKFPNQRANWPPLSQLWSLETIRDEGSGLFYIVFHWFSHQGRHLPSFQLGKLNRWLQLLFLSEIT